MSATSQLANESRYQLCHPPGALARAIRGAVGQSPMKHPTRPSVLIFRKGSNAEVSTDAHGNELWSCSLPFSFPSLLRDKLRFTGQDGGAGAAKDTNVTVDGEIRFQVNLCAREDRDAVHEDRVEWAEEQGIDTSCVATDQELRSADGTIDVKLLDPAALFHSLIFTDDQEVESICNLRHNDLSGDQTDAHSLPNMREFSQGAQYRPDIPTDVANIRPWDTPNGLCKLPRVTSLSAFCLVSTPDDSFLTHVMGDVRLVDVVTEVLA